MGILGPWLCSRLWGFRASSLRISSGAKKCPLVRMGTLVQGQLFSCALACMRANF